MTRTFVPATANIDAATERRLESLGDSHHACLNCRNLIVDGTSVYYGAAMPRVSCSAGDWTTKGRALPLVLMERAVEVRNGRLCHDWRS